MKGMDLWFGVCGRPSLWFELGLGVGYRFGLGFEFGLGFRFGFSDRN